MSEEPPTQSSVSAILKEKTWVDIFLAALTGYLVSGFMAVMAVLFLKVVPVENREIFVYMAGQLSGFTGMAIALWTSTTYHSNEKTKMLAQAQPIDLKQ